jgi:hypothetical protein
MWAGGLKEDPRRMYFHIRDLPDDEFHYPDRFKCPSLDDPRHFLPQNAQMEFDALMEIGFQPFVLRRPEAGFKSSVDGYPFKYALCAKRK